MKIRGRGIVSCASMMGSAALFGLYKGFAYGALASTEALVSSETAYDYLARCYLSVGFWTLIYLVGTRIQRPAVGQVTCVGSLFLIFVSYKLIYEQKMVTLNSVPEAATFLSAVLPVELLNVALTVSLVSAQVIALIYLFLRPKGVNAEG